MGEPGCARRAKLEAEVEPARSALEMHRILLRRFHEILA
jgi:hypothetical protein